MPETLGTTPRHTPHPPPRSSVTRRRKKRRKECRPEGQHCLRGLNVVGPGTGYCRLQMEPQTGTQQRQQQQQRQQILGPPDTQHDGKWHIQHWPLGRRCMRDLDVCWSWGAIIYYCKSDENSKNKHPPTPNPYARTNGPATKWCAHCGQWATVAAAWKSDHSSWETRRPGAPAPPPPPSTINLVEMPVGCPPTPVLC